MTTPSKIPTPLTGRYVDAVNYARIAHAAQVRKGTRIPYFQHLLAVSSLVIEHGGTEDQAIAALLHDVLEDCGAAHEHTIRAEFGDVVASIVKDCTDGSAEAKKEAQSPEEKRADWRLRKMQYVDHLCHASEATLLVSACDKLHNARAIVDDLENPEVGFKVFERFTAGVEGSLQYYHDLSEVFRERGAGPARAFAAAVDRMYELANRNVGVPFERRGLA
jgi:(p)ppGpp synthase/HD superfamily hydrolase